MKKLSLYGILVLCSFCQCVPVMAQQRVRLQFIDESNNASIPSVSVIAPDGTEIATSDKDGFATLAPGQGKYFLAIHKGYSPDTIRTMQSTVRYLQPLSVSLDDVVVTNRKVHRVLHSAKEYVVDYEFVDDNILVASYSGYNGRNAKLFLLNNAGDTLAIQKFPDEPVALFKSCIGRYYCVCSDKFYPLDITAGKILLGKPYGIEVLPLLKECEQNIGDKFYYHSVDLDAFSSIYSYRKMQENAYMPFYRIVQHTDAEGNAEEKYEIANMLSHGNFRGAARLNGMRNLRNNGSYHCLQFPIFRSSDSLVIFDFYKNSINCFAPDGAPIAKATMIFNPGKTFRINIVQDMVTGKYYVYNLRNQTLEEINIHSGKKLGSDIALQKPFPEKVKVHKGNIYYLWQDQQTNSTRQLFVQAPY